MYDNRFGGDIDNYPHPEVEMPAFKRAIDNECRNAPKVWCPIKKSIQPWIKTNYLHLGPKTVCTCTIC